MNHSEKIKDIVITPDLISKLDACLEGQGRNKDIIDLGVSYQEAIDMLKEQGRTEDVVWMRKSFRGKALIKALGNFKILQYRIRELDSFEFYYAKTFEEVKKYNYDRYVNEREKYKDNLFSVGYSKFDIFLMEELVKMGHTSEDLDKIENHDEVVTYNVFDHTGGGYHRYDNLDDAKKHAKRMYDGYLSFLDDYNEYEVEVETDNGLSGWLNVADLEDN